MRRFAGALSVAISTFLLACALLASGTGFVEDLENRSWDWRTRLTSDPGRADRTIKLIVVDQASLDFFEREYSLTWPIPRSAYAHVISFLTAAGAKGLAFDLLFTESSAQAVEGDIELAQAVRGSLPVVNALSLENRDKFTQPEKLDTFKKRQSALAQSREWITKYFGGKNPPAYSAATLPIPELIEASRELGTVHATPDRDGIYRRYPIGGALDGVPVLSLAFALAEATNVTSPVPLPIERDTVTVRLHGPSKTYESIPLALVMQAEADREEGRKPRLSLETFRDAWVIFGASAPGLLDLRPTSLEERGTGSEFVAAAFDNYKNGDFILRTGLRASMIISGAAIGLTTLIAFSFSSFAAQSLLILLCLTLFAAGVTMAASSGIWIPVAVPVGCSLLAAFASTGVRFQTEGRRNRFIRRAFQHYVSPDIVDEIVKTPHMLSLGGEKRELTVFFSDIVGFTSISEKLEPEIVVRILNRYLSLMSDVIHAHGGTVDKYVGDAVVAFWNAPLKTPRHAAQAVSAAIDCQQRLFDEAGEYLDDFGIDVKTRIGINTALVTVGNFGSADRFNYTVIGDGVNLGSRIEGVNKFFGTSVLFTKATYEQLSHEIRCRRIGSVRVAGKEEAIDIFEPLIAGNDHCFVETHHATFRDAIAAFDAGNFKWAGEKFTALKDDPVARAYCDRLRAATADDPITSPVWEFTAK